LLMLTVSVGMGASAFMVEALLMLTVSVGIAALAWSVGVGGPCILM
jgi:hypothetical protein